MLNMLLMLVVLTAPRSPALSGVIVAYDRTIHSYVEMAPDGTGVTPVPCGGDLSWGGPPRYFLTGGQEGGILAYAEEDAQTCSNGVVLFDDSTLSIFGYPRWSPDGTRVAFSATRRDLITGAILERGIFVLELDGSPLESPNVRLVVPTSGARSGSSPNAFSWSNDTRASGNQRLAYAEPVWDEVNGIVDERDDIFVAYVDDPAGRIENVTNSFDVEENCPAFSPVGNELVFNRTTVDTELRVDIYKRSLDPGGAETRLTSKKNLASWYNPAPEWSPDGAYVIFFSTAAIRGHQNYDIYRISSSGGKATRVSTTPDGYGTAFAPIWRD